MVGVGPSAAQGWVVKTSVRVTVCSWRVWISAMMSSYTLVTAGKLACPMTMFPARRYWVAFCRIWSG